MMTREEALKLLENEIYKWSMDWDEREDGLDYTEAIEIAIAALRHQIWKDQLWHDAKTDPPKTPGLYYGKKDDTNSMYACQYRDGVWVLDMYPQQKMDIVQWADYTAFVRGGRLTMTREEAIKVLNNFPIDFRNSGGFEAMEALKIAISALRPVIREQVEKVWRGEWRWVGEDRWSDTYECSKCGKLSMNDYLFCPNCNSAMNDEAVDIVMKRLEEMKNV